MMPAGSPSVVSEPSDPETPGEKEGCSEPPAVARQLEERSAELRALQRRLDSEIEERSRIERALRDSESRARQTEARLREAIESAADGFALWDADERLVLANQRYLDLYPEIAAGVRPGVAFAELAARLAASGCIREALGREAAWVAERLGQLRHGRGEPFERQLADGRWLRVRDHRTPDGGVVTLHHDITELKYQAEALQAREAQLRSLVDNIPGVVYRRVRHPDGRITYPYHSPQIELRHGFDAAAVANDARVLQDAVHPDDRAAWLAAIAASAERLSPFAGDYRIAVPGGEFRWFRTLATPTRQADGSVVWDGVSIDVSELKATELALRESEERYRRLIDAGPIALLTLHAGHVTFANAKALELLGGELAGRQFLTLVHPEDFPLALGLTDPALADERGGRPCELRVARPDGGRVDVEVVAVPISEHGAPATQLVLLDITERKRAEQQVRHLAHHDPLTGLPNRALLLDRLRQALRQARRERGRIAVVMLDLDHFKAINDSLGHPGGDRFLCAVAARLCATIRESDTLARFGGDEFTLVQTRLQDPHGAAVLAHKIVATLTEPFAIDGREIRVTTSAGVAIYPEDGNAPEPLIERADIALYRAKAQGRNRVTFFADALAGRPRREPGGRAPRRLKPAQARRRSPAPSITAARRATAGAIAASATPA